MHRLALAALILAALSSSARGNGVNTHVWVGLEGRRQLPPGTLREFLEREGMVQQMVNGGVFPDGGYAIEDGYGEIGHWEPFFSSYVKWIRETYQPPYQGEAAAHIAFLLGAASHGVADPVFDSVFGVAAMTYDTAGFGDGLLDNIDAVTDVLLVAATGQDVAPDEEIRPERLAEVFNQIPGSQYRAESSIFLDGQQLIGVAFQAVKQLAAKPERVNERRTKYPWTAAHLLDDWMPGSPRCLARLASAYQRALWFRLHDEHPAENWIIGTIPSDGSLGHFTDAAIAESQLYVVFGYEMHFEDLTPAMLSITDSAGKAYEVTVRGPYGGLVGTMLRLAPKESWAENEDFTVTIAPGLKSSDGRVLDQPFTFHFSTRVAPAGTLPPCQDPTPNNADPVASLIPLPRPEEEGGCQIGGAGQGGRWAVGWVLLLLAWRTCGVFTRRAAARGR
jgi:hypothetical protein